MEFILAQILGGIALILVSIGYFLKDKQNFMIIQIVANFFYALAFIAINSIVAGVIIFISLTRCVYIYFADKYNFKYKYHLLPIFIVLYIITTILLWKTPFDFMPLIASSIFTYGFAIKNLQAMRYILIIPNTLLTIYNVLVQTYASALLDLIEITVIVIAIIRFYKKNQFFLWKRYTK